jgi:hypothetical protein
LVLDPWQSFCVECILAERADGKWAAFEAALCVARQNGKGGVLEAVELAGLFLLGESLILHSAHEFKTAAEAFLRIKALIEGTPDLDRYVKTMRTSHGDEGVELHDGRRLRFVARSRSSGRGFTGDRVILDEAQELPVAAIGALMPTLSARPNPQIIYTFTVPAEENDSEHIESVRDRALAGGDPGLAYIGWQLDVDSIEEVDLNDRVLWTGENPALGYRITEETIERERRAMTDDVFARERLSVWVKSSSSTLVDPAQWAGLVGQEEVRPSPVAFSVVVAPDRSWCTISLAGRRADDLAHVQVVQTGRGTGWLLDRMADLAAEHEPLAVVVDPAGPEGSLIGDLEAKLDVPVVRPSGREHAQAVGAFVDAITGGTLRHPEQPVLSIALAHVKRRAVGDAWVFGSTDSTDVTPAKGAALALWGLGKAPKSRKRSGNVW